MAGRSERQGQPPGGEWEGAERESAAHSPGLALSLWQQEKGESQGRVKTHVHVVHGLGGHTEVTKAVLLGRVVLVSLGWEDPLEKGKATLSSILAWRIPWTEEPGGLQSMGSLRVGND